MDALELEGLRADLDKFQATAVRVVCAEMVAGVSQIWEGKTPVPTDVWKRCSSIFKELSQMSVFMPELDSAACQNGVSLAEGLILVDGSEQGALLSSELESSTANRISCIARRSLGLAFAHSTVAYRPHTHPGPPCPHRAPTSHFVSTYHCHPSNF